MLRLTACHSVLALLTLSAAGCREKAASSGGAVFLIAADSQLAVDRVSIESFEVMSDGKERAFGNQEAKVPDDVKLPNNYPVLSNGNPELDIKVKIAVWHAEIKLGEWQKVIDDVPTARWAAIPVVFGAGCRVAVSSPPEHLSASELPTYETGDEKSLRPENKCSEHQSDAGTPSLPTTMGLAKASELSASAGSIAMQEDSGADAATAETWDAAISLAPDAGFEESSLTSATASASPSHSAAISSSASASISAACASDCPLTCSSGLVACGGKCIDPQTDDQHCGATPSCASPGEVCGTDGICAAGACRRWKAAERQTPPQYVSRLLSDGETAITTWPEFNTSTQLYHVYADYFDGKGWRGKTQVSTNTAGFAGYSPSDFLIGAAYSHGSGMIAWLQLENSGSSGDQVYAAQVVSGKFQSPQRLADLGANYWAPLVATGNQHALVLWETQDGSGKRSTVRRFRGAWQPAESLTNEDVTDKAAAIGGTGVASVALRHQDRVDVHYFNGTSWDDPARVPATLSVLPGMFVGEEETVIAWVSESTTQAQLYTWNRKQGENAWPSAAPVGQAQTPNPDSGSYAGTPRISKVGNKLVIAWHAASRTAAYYNVRDGDAWGPTVSLKVNTTLSSLFNFGTQVLWSDDTGVNARFTRSGETSKIVNLKGGYFGAASQDGSHALLFVSTDNQDFPWWTTRFE